MTKMLPEKYGAAHAVNIGISGNTMQKEHRIKDPKPGGNFMTNDNSRPVYSTESGRMCPTCGRPLKKCACKDKRAQNGATSKSDDIIRIRRETKGRGGKIVTTLSGFDERDDGIKQLASELKNLCGSGGSSKDGVIMIQGDHREAVRVELERRGYKVKIAGG